MNAIRALIHCIILATTPFLCAHVDGLHPLPAAVQTASWIEGGWDDPSAEEWTRPDTYDDIVHMLDSLESGELEETCSLKQLAQINDYIISLAREGILPNEIEEEQELEEDIYDLMYGQDSPFEYVPCSGSSCNYAIVPTVLHSHLEYHTMPCNFLKKAWKNTKKLCKKAWKKSKNFCKKHKKAIVIGAIVGVATGGVAFGLLKKSSSSNSAEAAVAAGAVASIARAESVPAPPEPEPSISSVLDPPVPDSSEMPLLTSAVEEEISSFKQHLAEEHFFGPPVSGPALSLEETRKIIGPIFAHESLNRINDQLSTDGALVFELEHRAAQSHLPEITQYSIDCGHHDIGRKFSSDLTAAFSDPDQSLNVYALFYQMRGEIARDHGHYDQSVRDLTRAIHMDPTHPVIPTSREVPPISPWASTTSRFKTSTNSRHKPRRSQTQFHVPAKNLL